MSKQDQKALVPALRFSEFNDAGEWKEKSLGSVFTSVANGLSLDQTNDNTGYKVTRIETISDGTIDLNKVGYVKTEQNISAHRLCVGDMLFSNINSVNHIGKVAIIDRDCDLYHGMNLLRLVPDASSNSPIFLYYQLNTRRLKTTFEERANKAINQASINQTELKKTILFVPILEEQKKIADCLASVDELITAQTQKIDALKAHKKGLMQQLFPGEGAAVPKRRFPEFRDAPEWVEKPLGELCEVLQGYGFPEVMQGKRAGMYPFCKVSDISRAVSERGGFIREAANYVDPDDLKQLRAKPIPKGATVFAKIGEALRLNRRALTQVECLIDNNAVGLKARKGEGDDYFIFLLSQTIDLGLHCGGAVPSVNKSTLESIKVLTPSLPEQQKIADCLSSLDDLITAQIQKLGSLKTHKKGLMQQLFPVMDEVSA